MPMTFEQAQEWLEWPGYYNTYKPLVDAKELTVEEVREQFIDDAAECAREQQKDLEATRAFLLDR